MLRVLLTLAFLVVPLLEIFVIVSIGQVIGGWQTVGLLFAMSVLGTYLVRREGATTWRELQRALSAGRIPSRELADAALVLVGGTLLLTPGFLTDAVGFFLIVPLTRPLARRLLTRLVARRLSVVGMSGLPRPAGPGPGRPGPARGQHARTDPHARTDQRGPRGSGWAGAPGTGSRGGRVVQGEVIREGPGVAHDPGVTQEPSVAQEQIFPPDPGPSPGRRG